MGLTCVLTVVPGWGIACIIIAAILVCLVVLSGYVTYRGVFYTKPGHVESDYRIPDNPAYAERMDQIKALIDNCHQTPYEQVYTQSEDRLKLAARLYAGEPGKPVAILVHGYRSSPVRDCCGFFRYSQEKGFTVLLTDMRSRGESEGKCLTFGVKERRDVISWCRYAKTHISADAPIILGGVSMGGTSVLLAAGEPDLPENVSLVIGDSAYTSPEEIIRIVEKRRGIPEGLAWFACRVGMHLFGHTRLKGPDCRNAMARAKIPALIVHGEADTFVPCAMAQQINDARPEHTRLLIIPGAEHGISFLVDEAAYVREMDEMLAKMAEGFLAYD